jgi:hypothetical protein
MLGHLIPILTGILLNFETATHRLFYQATLVLNDVDVINYSVNASRGCSAAHTVSLSAPFPTRVNTCKY